MTVPKAVLELEPCATALAVNLNGEDRRSLAGVLAGSDWIVREARTCEEALSALRDEPVPVLLCGLQMPDGNWKTLARALRELGRPPALVVVSTLADDRLWAEVLDGGAYDLLDVPFDRSEARRVLALASTAFREHARGRRGAAGSGPRSTWA